MKILSEDLSKTLQDSKGNVYDINHGDFKINEVSVSEDEFMAALADAGLYMHDFNIDNSAQDDFYKRQYKKARNQKIKALQGYFGKHFKVSNDGVIYIHDGHHEIFNSFVKGFRRNHELEYELNDTFAKVISIDDIYL